MSAAEPPTGDINPYSSPTSELGRSEDAPFVVTGGVEFRGELTDDDRRRASRLRAKGAFFLSPWLLMAVIAVPFLLPPFFGLASGIVGGAALVMLCISLMAAWSRYTWWLALQLELPTGAFHGRASPQGVQYESPTWAYQLPWPEVEGYLCDEELVVLYAEGRAMAVPRHTFATQAAWATFCEFVMRARIKATN